MIRNCQFCKNKGFTSCYPLRVNQEAVSLLGSEIPIFGGIFEVIECKNGEFHAEPQGKKVKK